MFHTHVASVCPICFIYFKCMLHSSVSCCKCRPPALVSMRVVRAKPRPPTHGGGVGRHRHCGKEAQAARCYCGRDGGESLVWPGRDGRRVGVEEAGASHPSNVCSGSEAGGLDVSVGNKAGTGGRRIRANGVEQPAADFWTDASGRPGASAAKKV
jgi:hypothetical protein